MGEVKSNENENNFVEEVDHALRTFSRKFKKCIPDTSRSSDVATDVKKSSTVQGQDHVPYGLVTQLHRSLVSRYALTERWMHHHGRIVSN